MNGEIAIAIAPDKREECDVHIRKTEVNDRRLPPLNALRAFDAASRHMSFQKAAEELYVTPSALSFQIRQLEEHLQVSLFERLNRKVLLTEHGERFAPFVQDGFERLHSAMAQLRPPSDDNVLTVSTGPAFAAKWLSPRIYKFLDQHPDIEFRIAANLKLVDMREDPVDVAIRFGGGNYPDVYTEPLADEFVMPMVSPSLLEKHGGSLDESSLSDLMLLHDDSAAFLPNAVTWATWLKHAGMQGVDSTKGARFNHADHALEAAVDGAGVVLGRMTLAARDIKAGRLVAPFDLVLPARSGFYFCCLPEMRDMHKVKVFHDFIYEEIKAERAAVNMS
ncbi:MAG: transcriptional regulator GcvA [Pseudomonadota bacterium]